MYFTLYYKIKILKIWYEKRGPLCFFPAKTRLIHGEIAKLTNKSLCYPLTNFQQQLTTILRGRLGELKITDFYLN